MMRPLQSKWINESWKCRNADLLPLVFFLAAGTRTFAYSEEPMDAELQQVIVQAARTQHTMLDRLQASADVSIVGGHLVVFGQQFRHHTQGTTPPEVITGVIQWFRTDGCERTDWTFQLPAEVKKLHVVDQVRIFNAAERSEVIIFPQTRQSARVQADALGWRKPTDWLLPMFGRFFDDLALDPRVSLAMDAPNGDGTIVLHARFVESQETMLATVVLDPKLDHAVTRATWHDLGREYSIEYSRDDKGQLFPRHAEYVSTKADGGSATQWSIDFRSFERAGLPCGDRVFNYLPPGGTFADNVNHKSYRVQEDGTLREFKVAVDRTPRTKTAATRVGFTAAFGIAAVGLARYYFARGNGRG